VRQGLNGYSTKPLQQMEGTSMSKPNSTKPPRKPMPPQGALQRKQFPGQKPVRIGTRKLKEKK